MRVGQPVAAARLFEADRAERLVERAVEGEDELPDVGHRDRREDHRHEEQGAQHVTRHFSVRLSARANSSPRTLVRTRKPNARISVLTSDAGQLRGLEDLREVVEPDEVEGADAGPVGEGVEGARSRSSRRSAPSMRTTAGRAHHQRPKPSGRLVTGAPRPGVADRAVAAGARRALDGGHRLRRGHRRRRAVVSVARCGGRRVGRLSRPTRRSRDQLPQAASIALSTSSIDLLAGQQAGHAGAEGVVDLRRWASCPTANGAVLLALGAGRRPAGTAAAGPSRHDVAADRDGALRRRRTSWPPRATRRT